MSRILVVEDDAENRDALGRWLKRRGFDVLSAPNGRTGVEMARLECPDLILMDMDLPELNGWEATRQIRADANGAAVIPVIALTAHAMSGDRERALAAGVPSTTPSRSSSARSWLASRRSWPRRRRRDAVRQEFAWMCRSVSSVHVRSAGFTPYPSSEPWTDRRNPRPLLSLTTPVRMRTSRY